MKSVWFVELMNWAVDAINARVCVVVLVTLIVLDFGVKSVITGTAPVEFDPLHTPQASSTNSNDPTTPVQSAHTSGANAAQIGE